MSQLLSSPSLAINGGSPLRSAPWLDNFTIGTEEKAAVLRVLDSGYLSLYEGSFTPDAPFSFNGGPEVRALESEWSTFYKVDHSIAMNSATSCLYASIGALGIGYGDEVIVSPYTMTACATAPLIYGAIPVFADIDINTGCLDPLSISKLISPRTKAILVVHQFGFPADMESIMRLAREHNLFVIEDCAQSHMAKIHNQYVGTFGDIGVFSLNVNKTIQSGEGGIAVTSSSDIAYRLQLIRNHGEAVVGPAKYLDLVNIIGFNYRMTEITASIAREQLKKLPELTLKRLELVLQLQESLQYFPFITCLGNSAQDHSTPNYLSSIAPTYYLFPFRLNANILGCHRDEFVAALNAEGFLFSTGYTKPLYFQPLYQKRQLFCGGYPFSAPPNINLYQNYSPGICPVAESFHFHELVLSEHIRPPHTAHDVSSIVDALNKITFSA
jgi:perosamine synthetase